MAVRPPVHRRQAQDLPRTAQVRLLRHSQSVERRHRALSAGPRLQGAGDHQLRPRPFAKAIADGAQSMDDVLAHYRELAAATDIPLNADFENGFADDPDERRRERDALHRDRRGRTVDRGFHRRQWPTPLYDFDLALARVKAARAAIDKAGGDVVFTARAEGFIRGRPDLDETIRRLKAFADAGADCLYSPGIKTREQIEATVKAVAPKAVNFLNSGAFGFTVNDLAGMGVRRISVGGSLARVAMHAFIKTATRDRQGRQVRRLRRPRSATPSSTSSSATTARSGHDRRSDRPADRPAGRYDARRRCPARSRSPAATARWSGSSRAARRRPVGRRARPRRDLDLYVGYGPFADGAAFAAWLAEREQTQRSVFLRGASTPTAARVGIAALMEIRPGHAGDRGRPYRLCRRRCSARRSPPRRNICSRAMCSRRCGYRRYEWKCNALNAPSRRAAERFGFAFEGVFRQHMIVKGRSRDTA